MLLKIKGPTTEMVIPAVNAGAILAALENARYIETSGWGDSAKTSFHKDGAEISFVADNFIEPPTPPLEAALESARSNSKMWLDEYGKRSALEKEVKELKAKLAAVSTAAT